VSGAQWSNRLPSGTGSTTDMVLLRNQLMENQRKARLAKQIKDEVSRQMKRFAMAKSREDFINRLVEVLIPALRHHYRVTLGKINNRTDQVDKWSQQEAAFLDLFSDRLQEATKAKGFDRRKAVDQALKELWEQDDARVRLESSTFQRTYKLKKLIPIPELAREEFLARVMEIGNMIYPE
jgi:hypothetical protein